MSEPNFQTVRLSKGRHSSPEQGACVVELASMLAGEPFSDRPASVCPVIAAFLRAYNDKLSVLHRNELYPYAPMVVGSAASWSVRKQRGRLLKRWVRKRQTFGWLTLPAPWIGVSAAMPFQASDWIALAAANVAVALPTARRQAAVNELLESLLGIGQKRGGAQSPMSATLPASAERVPLGRGSAGI